MVHRANATAPCLRTVSGRIKVLWLSAAVVKALFREAARAFPSETGGVLMGYQVEIETVVSDVIGPGPNAQHSRTAYMPDHEYQELEVARVYQESGRRTTYVGDWHTHPNGRLYLSRTDSTTLKSISAHSPARVRRPVMAIVAGKTGDWRIGAWQWMPRQISALSRAIAVDVRGFE
jgi:integrative and conjugative element protein (TIGR02256 family)